MLACITTYASPKTADETTKKSIPLMNTPFLLSLLLSGFEVNCGLNVDCIVDIVEIDLDEDIIAETENNESNILYNYN